MSRRTLALFALDRPALKALSAELEGLLLADDRAGLARLLGLEPARLEGRARLVDHLLVAESGPADDLYVALRGLAVRRALRPGFASDAPALEGRLRAFDVLREDAATGASLDRLLNPRRLPWYLRRHGATGGWLDGDERRALVERLRKVAPRLTPELRAFAQGLEAIPGDVIAHDGL